MVSPPIRLLLICRVTSSTPAEDDSSQSPRATRTVQLLRAASALEDRYAQSVIFDQQGAPPGHRGEFVGVPGLPRLPLALLHHPVPPVKFLPRRKEEQLVV